MMKSTCARLQVHANCLQDVGLMPCTSIVKLKITALSLKIDSTLQRQHIICASKHLTKIVEQCTVVTETHREKLIILSAA